MSAPMPEEAPVMTAVPVGDGVGRGISATTLLLCGFIRKSLRAAHAQMSVIGGALAANPVFGRPYISSMVDNTL